jgi:thiamine-monophosphate kinase
MKTLAEIGEFGFIRKILPALDSSDDRIVIGPGDDAAVVKNPEGLNLVYTTDLLVEGFHFLPDWHWPEELGHKAAAVNLSDLAAMGARPDWLLVAVACPESTEVQRLEGLLRGMSAYARQWNTRILGGDTCRADRLILSITAIGSVPAGQEVALTHSRAGQSVYVTGAPGLSALGYQALKRWGRQKTEEKYPNAVRAHLTPEPPLGLAPLVAEKIKPGAMTDVSDGLGRDLGKICQASGVGAFIDFSSLQWHKEILDGCKQLDLEPEQLALSGGEDYSLLFTAPEERVESHRAEIEEALQEIPLKKIGRLLPAGEGFQVRLLSGKQIEVNPEGFDHFRKGSS